MIRPKVNVGFRCLVLLSASLVVGCAPGPRRLTILYTNDIHATCHPVGVVGDSAGRIGGVVALEREVGAVRARHATLLLDAGDLLSGGPLGSLSDGGVKGGHLIRLMNALGYDAMGIGNHDLDHGPGNLIEASRRASFPLLAANLLDEGGNPLVGPGWCIVRRGRVRVGIIGLVTPGVAGYLPPDVARRVRIRPPEVVGDSLARLLDPRTDLLVVLSHCGLATDRLLAKSLGPRVDLIVGGHSHDLLRVPERQDGVLIVHAGSRLRFLGRLDLRIKDDRIVDYVGQVIELRAEKEPERVTPVKVLCDSLESVLEEAFGDTVAFLASALTRAYHDQSPLGNWVADALRLFTGADVAFVNSGTLRADLLPGPVRVRDIRDVLPFENTVVTFTCSGRQLESILRHNAEAAVARSHGILQVSGCTCRYRIGTGQTEIRVGGLPLDPDARYRCATVDFVALRSPLRYLGLVPDGVEDHAVVLSEAVASVAGSEGLSTSVEGRLVLEGG